MVVLIIASLFLNCCNHDSYCRLIYSLVLRSGVRFCFFILEQRQGFRLVFGVINSIEFALSESWSDSFFFFSHTTIERSIDIHRGNFH